MDLFEALLDLSPKYDAVKQTFLLDSNSVSGSSVRIVKDKKIPAQHPPNAVGGGAQIIDPLNPNRKNLLYDTFNGVIDELSGHLLHGNRKYILTGEEYEGPFRNNLRHGEGAIVNNVYLPSVKSKVVAAKGPRFYGSYRDDSPLNGTLVVPGYYTYHGPFLNSQPHGEAGTIIHASGHKYEGGFSQGNYHGQGIETEAASNGDGVYKGQFISGLRQGYGSYAIQRRSCEGEDIDASLEERDEGGKIDKAGLSPYLYKYQGQWNNNRRQGEGEEKTANGEIYRGQFHSNERHGYGMLSFPIAAHDSKNEEHSNSDENILTTDSSKVLTSAEGIWRAGIPLDGTYGWTLTYLNGDVYTGFASNFVPNGYGVKRHVNRDIYSGEWKNGNREGEGIFISASGREEFHGTWHNDKIVPKTEGKDDARRSTLTDLTLSLLQGKSEITAQNKNSVEDLDEAEKIEGNFGKEADHQHRRELLGKIMHDSLSTSLELLQKNEDQTYGNSGILPKNWTSDGDSLCISSVPNAHLYDNAIKLLSLEGKSKESICESQLEHIKVDSENNIKGDVSDKQKSSLTRIIHYPNGDSYLGGICNETKNREGYGVYLSCATGSTYSGDFKQGLRHGYGILMHPLGKYCGDFLDDEKHGMGTLILNDSSSYFGEFLKGNIHGRGTLCEKNGTVYIGEWKDGRRDGDGYETLKDGSVYMGEFCKGERHGVGTMLAKSGGPVIYSGSWSEGLYHGEGVAILRVNPESAHAIPGCTFIAFDSKSDSHTSRVQYEGSFTCGQLDGFGTLTNNTDKGVVVSKGNWRKNTALPGKWRIQFADGAIYSGEAKTEALSDNRFLSGTLCNQGLMLSDLNIITPTPHGFGTMMYANGDLYIGSFVDNIRHGVGTCQFANGDNWEGVWDNDSMDKNRNGTLTFADGKVRQYSKISE